MWPCWSSRCSLSGGCFVNRSVCYIAACWPSSGTMRWDRTSAWTCCHTHGKAARKIVPPRLGGNRSRVVSDDSRPSGPHRPPPPIPLQPGSAVEHEPHLDTVGQQPLLDAPPQQRQRQRRDRLGQVRHRGNVALRRVERDGNVKSVA